MAVSNKKNCINNSDYSYSGREQNPLGLGFTPECEEVGKKMLGRDGKTYIISVKNNKKIWMRVKEDDLSLSTDLVKDIPIIQETIATDDEYSTDDEKDKKDEEEVEEVEEKKEEKQEEKKKMTRKAPKEKANNFDIGFQKEGADGNMYEIVENKNGVKKWMKVKEEKKNVKKEKKNVKKEKKSMDGGDDNEKKEKKEKKKRAPSTYNLFIKQKMIEIRKNNDDIVPKECMKLATAEWKKLSDDEKDNFKKSLE
jgi:hypothetical protein